MRGIITKEILADISEIDFNSGYRYFLGNMENYKQALLAIHKSIKSKIPILQSMLATREYEGLRIITQTLQRMMNNIGALGIAETSYWLEVTLLNEEESILQEELYDYVNTLILFSSKLEKLFKDIDVKNNTATEETNTFLKYDLSKTKESIKQSSIYLERNII